MKFLIHFILFLLSIPICAFNSEYTTLNSNNGFIWKRIPINRTKERVNAFIMERDLENCFEFYENPSLLRLKCWSHNELVDVTITVHLEKKSIYI